MSSRFPADVESILRKAGWFEGRRVDLSSFELPACVMFPAASAILAEFGGLDIGECGSGIDMARGNVDLRADRFAEVSDAAYLGGLFGVRLYPIALYGRERANVYVDESGRVYSVHQDPLRVDLPSFDAVLGGLVAGRKFPMTWL